ncbi:MAG: DUF87 domain-containing protein [bacterium]|nr:DUF87 domain-containing protein [bacterium]
MEPRSSFEKKLASPEAEMGYLREKMTASARLEQAERSLSREARAAEAVEEYKGEPAALHPSYEMKQEEREGIALNLKKEAHDAKMEELLGILLERGVKNAMGVVGELKDPHVDDDFHRFLVQYLVAAGKIEGMSARDKLFKGVNMKLYRVALPRTTDDKAGTKEFIARMEQFYAGMLSLSDGKKTEPGKNYFALEWALPEGEEALSLYAAVPRDKTALFEKQFLSFYPGASLIETPDDYNVFVEGGASLGAVGVSSVHEAFSIKTYEKFEHDPLEALLGAFGKIRKEGEGVAVQVLLSPAGDYFMKRFGEVIEQVDRGVPLSRALPARGLMESFARAGNELFVKAKKAEAPSAKSERGKALIKEKIGSTILSANIRVAVSATTLLRAKELMGDVTAAWNQLREPEGNGISFEIKEGRAARTFFHEFSYRLFSEPSAVPLNLKEITTMFHVPKAIAAVPTVSAKSKTAPAPLSLPGGGTLLGMNRYQGRETEVRIAAEDRMRHLYVIGSTGTGKSTLLKQMAIQDIEKGAGVCMIDPHGQDLDEVLSHIPPDREGDVIYFDPSATARPLGLNMLEYDPRFPEQKTFVVNELLAIFNKLFDMKVAGGPAFEQYFRNAAFLVMEHPESGSTLLDIARVMSDKEYRHMKLSKATNPLLLQFWQNAERTTGEQGLQNFVPYITNKFDVFLSNDIMRPIVAQERSAFNFRDVIDHKKILLVNLSKGRLGEINSALIGLIVVGKLLMAALSRADAIARGSALSDFFLYIDEFQNVTTDSIATILSEARKYRLSLTVAHQYIAQLDQRIKDAVFGNVGSLVSFRVGQDDAAYLEKQFAPVFTAVDLTALENRSAYAKLLVNGEPTQPFSLELLPPREKSTGRAETVKRASEERYGRPREEIEEAIRQKYKVNP